ncbi:hypothetical protein FD754_024885 [Muntiacus muntjak]|uniref:WH1 domain-containing protein n=1 Tax=Muntiacus muntjak TaxID=9888 RepID=A0A5N3UMY2_MUNMU|nr:hypothetical protein FD754_024885 [Muntiacus muntjak]
MAEQPIFSTRAHVFQIDPNTKKNWVPTSKHAVTVSYFYDSTRNVYRIISLDGAKTQLSAHACMQASIELHAEIFYKSDFSLFDKYSLHICSVGHYAKFYPSKREKFHFFPHFPDFK